MLIISSSLASKAIEMTSTECVIISRIQVSSKSKMFCNHSLSSSSKTPRFSPSSIIISISSSVIVSSSASVFKCNILNIAFVDIDKNLTTGLTTFATAKTTPHDNLETSYGFCIAILFGTNSPNINVK